MRKIVIPEELIKNQNLRLSDVIIYGILLNYNYKDMENRPICILRNSEIAEATNFSQKTISDSIKRLEENKIIKTVIGKCFFASQTVYRKIYPQLY